MGVGLTGTLDSVGRTVANTPLPAADSVGVGETVVVAVGKGEPSADCVVDCAAGSTDPAPQAMTVSATGSAATIRIARSRRFITASVCRLTLPDDRH
ncbi:hypothetical protein GCM10027290_41970 [Micromonospora sonneratiae]